MPDGKRKRRHSTNQYQRRWYAQHRAIRFAKRFGIQSNEKTRENSNRGNAQD